MFDRSPADYRLRYLVWSALLAWCAMVWIAIIAFIAAPAAKAIVEAASNPAACAGYARSDCAAVMGER
jgi:hypothetical protein